MFEIKFDVTMKKVFIQYSWFVVLLMISCGRDFLDAKPNKSLSVPNKLEDYQAMLDNASVMSEGSLILAIAGADEYYYTEEEWNAATDPINKNAYIWADDVFVGRESLDWSYAYRKILYCNTILKGLDEIQVEDAQLGALAWARGQALFYRSMAFYHLMQVFAPVYDPLTAETDMGIPLVIVPEIDAKHSRVSVADCYERMVLDLNESIPLLRDMETYRERPIKDAARALLAKVYLDMHEYGLALGLAEQVMAHQQLMDYNDIDPTQNLPFPFYTNENPEILFNAICRFGPLTTVSPEPSLLASYTDDDLRNQLYFRTVRDKLVFYGSYAGAAMTPFGGLAVDEMHLIAAECAYLMQDYDKSRAILKGYLPTRFKIGGIPDVDVLNNDNLLEFILEEKRRQLAYRGTRWNDIRRHNRLGTRSIEIRRVLHGEEYMLEPNDLKTVWPIPPSAIELGGFEQNPR